MSIRKILDELKSLGNMERAEVSINFFKTKKGEYGYGDVFWGVSVPDTRNIAKKYWDKFSIEELEMFINHEVHEVRFLGTEVLKICYNKCILDKFGLPLGFFPPKRDAVAISFASEGQDMNLMNKIVYDNGWVLYLDGFGDGCDKDIAAFYLSNLKGINNRDLVDNTAYSVLGNYLLDKDRKLLYDMARFGGLWEQRIAIVATMAFVRKGEWKDTVELSKILLFHDHDLIQKAVGWLLREMGKNAGEKHLLKFLEKHCSVMPRTMLRYSIEKLDMEKRKYYMNRKLDGFDPKILLAYLKTIPKGKLETYKSLADRFGIHPRKVAMILKYNTLPNLYPCYKVIANDGTLGGYNLGLEEKKRRIEIDGSK